MKDHPLFAVASIKILLLVLLVTLLHACRQRQQPPSAAQIASLELRQGPPILCGPPRATYGTVFFRITGDSSTQEAFNQALSLLHSFEYEEAEKRFARIIEKTPNCAMAYWGVAMCNFHALWTPPRREELLKGSRALRLALSIRGVSAREIAYLHGLEVFYTNWEHEDHHRRCQRFEKAMAGIYQDYPDDKEAAIFYALALNAAALPEDKTYSRQRQAGRILEGLYRDMPDHPGVIHYIIHSYDYPELASRALNAARRYASVAPSSAHALHMPSHIFTRLGHWQEDIATNLKSVDAARCYAQQGALAGHWDEELHGLDYLVYAYLQQGNYQAAENIRVYVDSLQKIEPLSSKAVYAMAAIPARVVLEAKNWPAAAVLEPPSLGFNWQDYPWQAAMTHLTRLLGQVHLHHNAEAQQQLAELRQLKAGLVSARDDYAARQVEIQIQTGQAWIDWAFADTSGALQTMEQAADLEDRTGKHPVTPGALRPARELLADMQMEAHRYPEALQTYEASLVQCPNRLNSLLGAALAAARSRLPGKARYYYDKILSVRHPASAQKEMIQEIQNYLAAQS
ncbi:hypothetical protein GCM10027051_20830 [Niabella terrae]